MFRFCKSFSAVFSSLFLGIFNFSSLAPASAQTTFSDIRGHWSQRCIEQLAQENWVSGFQDALFYPDAPLSRGLYADMLVRTFADQPTRRPSILFVDVPSSYPYAESIEMAYRQGFFEGSSFGQFQPDRAISRQDFWVALAHGLEYQATGDVIEVLSDAYNDEGQIAAYAQEAVAAATERTLVVLADTPRQFHPNQPITRAEAAAALCQIRFKTTASSGVPAQFVVELPTLAEPIQEDRSTKNGTVQAQLSYSKNNYRFETVHLTLVRQDQVLLDQPLAIEGGFTQNLGLQISDLEGDQEPEVIVDVIAGAGRCCSYSLIYSYLPRQQTYGLTRQDWGYVPSFLTDFDQDGIPEFRSGDTRFTFRFAQNYSDLAWPLQIWQYRQGKLFDVTRLHPQAVEANVTQLWQTYQVRRNEQSEVKGILAAYAAGKFILDEGEEGFRQVAFEYGAADRSRYLRELREFLRGTGYANN
jgi:hypothetical protein